jgi:FtsH-binding integral membrane protein
MIEWIQEINWFLVFTISIPIVIGNEFQRRRAEAEGEIYSFLPRGTYRIVNLALAFSGAMLAASATVALKQPTTFHVWMLIVMIAASIVNLIAFNNLEMKWAKRAVADAGRVASQN